MSNYKKTIHLSSCPVYGKMPCDDEPCRCISAEKLEAENQKHRKLLKEQIDINMDLMRFGEKLRAENKALKQNRNELLEELKLARAGFKSILIDNAIQEAEALKEKSK